MILVQLEKFNRGNKEDAPLFASLSLCKIIFLMFNL